SDRLISVHGVNLAQHRSNHAGWIALRERHNAVRKTQQREWHVNFRHYLVPEAAVQRVLHHTDDLKGIVLDGEGSLLQSRNANGSTQRLPTVQPGAREGLIDDGQMLLVVHFALSEQPALEERDPKNPRVIGIDLMNHDRSRPP